MYETGQKQKYLLAKPIEHEAPLRQGFGEQGSNRVAFSKLSFKSSALI